MADRTAFRMPSLGADMVAGTVLAWHVSPGDRVAPGDLVALVDTDKAEIDIETFDAGIVGELVVPVGEQVPVGTVIAYFEPVGAGVPAASAAAPRTGAAPAAPAAPATPAAPVAPATPVALAAGATPTGTGPAEGAGPSVAAGGPPPPHTEPRVVSPLVRHLAEARHLDPATLSGSGPGHRVLRRDVETGRTAVSPRARRLAAEAGLDPDILMGTGPGGAVTGADVLVAAATAPLAAAAPGGDAPTVVAGAAAPTRTVATTPAGTARPAAEAGPSRMRQAIAELMTRSWREIPHYHLATRVDVSPMLAWLARTNEERPLAERVLPAAVLLRATALAASHHPGLNGWWVDGTFRPATRVDVATVVSLRGGGLLAPTIADAAARSLPEVMQALREVVGRARRGRLRSSDTIPASITVTSLGDLGVDQVFGVIHPPQVALVGIGAIHEEAWAVDGMVAARPVVHLSLAGDHRVSDGLAGAAFLAEIARLLEDPEKL